MKLFLLIRKYFILKKIEKLTARSIERQTHLRYLTQVIHNHFDAVSKYLDLEMQKLIAAEKLIDSGTLTPTMLQEVKEAGNHFKSNIERNHDADAKELDEVIKELYAINAEKELLYAKIRIKK